MYKTMILRVAEYGFRDCLRAVAPVICRLLVIGFVGLAGGAVNAAPRLVCAQPNYEFVYTNGQSRVDHAFELNNAGDMPLVIEKVRVCCGASFKMADKTIAPSTNAVLELSMDLRGKTGQIRKSIYVHTNDPQCPILSIRLIGMASAGVHSP